MTWSRDTHGLFDYESNYITKRNITALNGGKIIRIDNDVEFISSSQSISDFGDNAKPLLFLQETNGILYIVYIMQVNSKLKMVPMD